MGGRVPSGECFGRAHGAAAHGHRARWPQRPGDGEARTARSVRARRPRRLRPSMGVVGRARRPPHSDDPGHRRRHHDGHLPRHVAQPGDERGDDVDLPASARTADRTAQSRVAGTIRRADSRQQREPGADRSAGRPHPPSRIAASPSSSPTSSRPRGRRSAPAAG